MPHASAVFLFLGILIAVFMVDYYSGGGGGGVAVMVVVAMVVVVVVVVLVVPTAGCNVPKPQQYVNE